METKDFFFDVPPELIAQQPPAERDASRLMVLDRRSAARTEARVRDLPALLDPGTLVVVNDTRVEKKRLAAKRSDGREAEILLISTTPEGLWMALVGGPGRFKAGLRLELPGGRNAELLRREGRHWLLSIGPDIEHEYLERYGAVPLPPYIRRQAVPEDEGRYQTVYAQRQGSAAAPTAGLHFSEELFDRIKTRGCEIASVTLHVGIDTFAPIRTEQVEAHTMHGEHYEVSAETAATINRAKGEGRTVLAVGTTTVRTLESATVGGGEVAPGSGTTDLYIYPGYQFTVVDSMFTNFHTPGSSLVVMVSAFAGWDLIRESYEDAIARGFRFFSYGDAMLIR